MDSASGNKVVSLLGVEGLKVWEVLEVVSVDITALKAAGCVPAGVLTVRVFASGKLTRKVVLKGIVATKGAKAAIEAAGGQVA